MLSFSQTTADSSDSSTAVSERYASVDSWRGLSCVLLVLFHASFYVPGLPLGESFRSGAWADIGLWLVKKAWIGVPIFFVVSGYCIATSVDRLKMEEKPVRRFLVRRFHRIYPPLWAALALAMVFWSTACLFPEISAACNQIPVHSPTPAHLVGNLTLTETWIPWAAFGEESRLLLPNLWTLCFEEQFYLLCALGLAVSPRHFQKIMLFITLCVAGSLAWRWYGGDLWPGLFLEGHWLLFAAGLTAWHVLAKASVNFNQRFACLTALGAMVLACLSIGRFAPSESLRHLMEYLAVAGSFAILLVMLRPLDGRIASSWVAKVLSRLGGLSYSIYLTHYPVVTLLSAWFYAHGCISAKLHLTVTLPLCLAVSLPVAWLFHYLVERHFLPSSRTSCAASSATLATGVLARPPEASKT